MHLFPKPSICRRPIWLKSRKRFWIAEVLLSRGQRVGDVTQLTACLGGGSLLLARSRRDKTAVFALESQAAQFSIPPLRKRFPCARSEGSALNSNNFEGRVIPHSGGRGLRRKMNTLQKNKP